MSAIHQLQRHAEAPQKSGRSHLNRSNFWDATLTASDVEFYVMVLNLPGEGGPSHEKGGR